MFILPSTRADKCTEVRYQPLLQVGLHFIQQFVNISQQQFRISSIGIKRTRNKLCIMSMVQTSVYLFHNVFVNYTVPPHLTKILINYYEVTVTKRSIHKINLYRPYSYRLLQTHNYSDMLVITDKSESNTTLMEWKCFAKIQPITIFSYKVKIKKYIHLFFYAVNINIFM